MTAGYGKRRRFQTSSQSSCTLFFAAAIAMPFVVIFLPTVSFLVALSVLRHGFDSLDYKLIKLVSSKYWIFILCVLLITAGKSLLSFL